MESKIPTYSSEGRRLRRYTLEAIERLEQLNLVAVQRNRRGRIVCAHFRGIDGANPIQNAPHSGTFYSSEETLPSGRSAWKHRGLVRDRGALESLLGEAPEDLQEAEVLCAAIFQRVLVSCIAKPRNARATRDKVVSIDAGGKRKRAGSRPLEFDSELRAA